MEIKENKLKGIFEITLSPITDNRGFFMRTFDIDIFAKNELGRLWVQENHAKTINKNVVRGLHFQLPPFTETKLVRCINGRIWDVFVDLREGSQTFGNWGAVELSQENNKMIYIPRGFAHGYCTITNISDVVYKVDNFYTPESECGILWNDKDINITWPASSPIVSEKDRKNITLAEFISKHKALKSF